MNCNNPRCTVADNSRPYGLCDTCYFRPEIAKIFRQWNDGKRPCGIHTLSQGCTCPLTEEQRLIGEALVARVYQVLAHPAAAPGFNVNLDKVEPDPVGMRLYANTQPLRVPLAYEEFVKQLQASGITVGRVDINLDKADNDVHVVMDDDKKVIGIFGPGVDIKKVLQATFIDPMDDKTEGLPPIDYENLARPYTEEEMEILEQQMDQREADDRSIREKHGKCTD